MDALALVAEDGRGKTAISPGELSSKPSRGFPNGDNPPGQNSGTCQKQEGTRGTETSKYPEEKKTTVIPLVAASERGEAQTVCACTCGVAGRLTWSYKFSS